VYSLPSSIMNGKNQGKKANLLLHPQSRLGASHVQQQAATIQNLERPITQAAAIPVQVRHARLENVEESLCRTGFPQTRLASKKERGCPLSVIGKS